MAAAAGAAVIRRAALLAAAALVLGGCGSAGKSPVKPLRSAPASQSPSQSPSDSPTPSDSPSPDVVTPTDSPTPTGSTKLALGEAGRVTQSGTDNSGNPTTSTADLTVTGPQVATVEPGDFGSKPEHGFFVVFTAAFTAGSSGGFDVNSAEFYVRGADGTHYDEAVAVGFGSTLALTTLTPGEKTKGVIVFDVPSPHGTLVYTGPGDTALGEWTF